MKQARKIIDNMKYFVKEYLPYALSCRIHNSNFQEALKIHNIHYSYYKSLIYTIYEMGGTHPDMVNLYEVYEYEMSIYAPEYYYNTYLSYMRLRSGRIVIPPGEEPMFYWIGNEYVKAFI